MNNKKLDSDGNLRIQCIITSNRHNDQGQRLTILPSAMLSMWREYQKKSSPIVVQHALDEFQDKIVGYVESIDFTPRDYSYTEGIPEYLKYEAVIVVQDPDVIAAVLSGKYNAVSIAVSPKGEGAYFLDESNLIYKEGIIDEISLVDVPANPDCYFNVIDQDEVEEEAFGIGEEVIAFGQYFRLRDIVDGSYFLDGLDYSYMVQSSEVRKVDGYMMAMLPENYNDKFVDFIEQEDVVKWEHEPHITLAYGLNSPTSLAQKIKSPIKVRGGKVFEKEDSDVLVLELSKTQELEDIHLDLLKETEKEYIPHITIAYLKKGQGKKYLSMLDEQCINFVLPEDIITYCYSDNTEIVRDSVKTEYYNTLNTDYTTLKNIAKKRFPSYNMKQTLRLLQSRNNWSTEDYEFAKHAIYLIKEESGKDLTNYGYVKVD